MAINLCILGAAGVGKSVLNDLLKDGVEIIEPFRARTEGARYGEKVYISPVILSELLILNRRVDRGPILCIDSDKNIFPPYLSGNHEFRKWLEVYQRATFFMVGNTKQILLHHKIKSELRKVEIFAPVLLDILENRALRGIIPFLENIEKTIFLLLNPLNESILNFDPRQIINWAGWGRNQWQEIQDKRNKQKNKRVEPGDVQARIELLPIEMEAWRAFAQMAEKNKERYSFIECVKWNHFEYKYPEKGTKEYTHKLKDTLKDIMAEASKAGLDESLKKFFLNMDNSKISVV